MCSKKDYVAVAKILNSNSAVAKTPREHVLLQSVAEDLANYFAQDNKAFDKARFFEACDVI